VSEDLIDELIHFVRLQLDEDERLALATSPVGDRVWHVANGTGLAQGSWLILQPHHGAQSLGSHGVEHIARHDPARVLREVEALRAIIDLHEPREYVTYLKHVTYWQCGYCAGLCHSRSGLGCEQPVDALWPCDTVRLLAAIFSDRPGYREEWRP
jgi:hypothetical protein